jgi:hypothetical protein
MGWLTATSSDNTIVESKKYLSENISVVWGGAKQWVRTRVITVTRYVGMTKSAAETQAALDAGTANCTDAHTEATGGGSYAAVSTYDVRGEWTEVTPPAVQAPK